MTKNAITQKKQRDMTLLSEHIDGLCKQPRLRRLFWEATTQCNLSCLHCGSNCGGFEADAEGSLTTDEMKSFLTRFAKDFSQKRSCCA